MVETLMGISITFIGAWMLLLTVFALYILFEKE